MIPANGAPHDLEARYWLRSLPFAQRRARDDSNQLGASPPNLRSAITGANVLISIPTREGAITTLLSTPTPTSPRTTSIPHPTDTLPTAHRWRRCNPDTQTAAI